MNIKRKIYFIMESNKIFKTIMKISIKINLLIFHFNERRQSKSFGKENSKNTIYVIRPRGKTEGLMSTFYYVIRSIKWCEKKGYLPFIDFEKIKCQYNVDRPINGNCNAWEYYFIQHTDLSIDEVYQSKNVILSGWSFFEKKDDLDLNTVFSSRNEMRDYIKNGDFIQTYIWEIVERYYESKMQSKITMGIFLRGTDYVQLKPKGHYRQPSIEMVISKAQDFLNQYSIEQIFLVTEDRTIYDTINKHFNGMVICSDYNFVSSSYKDFVAESFKNDPYKRGLDYLVRLLLLTKCEYLVSSIASGSNFVLDIKKGEYKDKYMFDLGLY